MFFSLSWFDGFSLSTTRQKWLMFESENGHTIRVVSTAEQINRENLVWRTEYVCPFDIRNEERNKKEKTRTTVSVREKKKSWNSHEMSRQQTFHQLNFTVNVDGSHINQVTHIKHPDVHKNSLQMFAFIIRWLCLRGAYLFSHFDKNEQTYFISFPLGLIIIYSHHFWRNEAFRTHLVRLFTVAQFNFRIFFN